MALHVVACELTDDRALATVAERVRTGSVRLLVRSRGRPVGALTIWRGWTGMREVDDLRRHIERELAPGLRRVALARRLGETWQRPALDMWPQVTVAVCTRDRPESLARALASIDRLDYPPGALDLLVVDNAATGDATASVVRAFPRWRYAREPRPGLDRARNRAIAEARGEIVAFTDDDVEVDPGWVRAAALHFANPEVMAVTGLVEPAELETRAQERFEAYGGFGRGYEVCFHTMGAQRSWRWWPLSVGVCGTGCNMTFRKALFERIGRFDPRLDVGAPTQGAGDLDLFYRTLRAGHVLVYEPSALVRHHHRREDAALRRQLRCFGRGVYAFWTKTLLHDRGMRMRTLEFATWWYVKWFAGRMVRKCALPRSLVLSEALGALEGPIAWFRSRRWAG